MQLYHFAGSMMHDQNKDLDICIQCDCAIKEAMMSKMEEIKSLSA